MNGRTLTVAAALGTALVGGGWIIGRGLNVRETDFTNARLFDTVLGHVRQFFVDSIADSTLYEHAMVGMLRELDDGARSELEHFAHRQKHRAELHGHFHFYVEQDIKRLFVRQVWHGRNPPGEVCG